MMIRPLSVVVAVAATTLVSAVMTAAPAQADEASYLQALQPKFAFLNSQQLLDAGHKVCEKERGGMTSADAVNMVSKDLSVSLAVASEIVSAAVVNFGC